MSDLFFLACHACGRRAFLFRGRCATCAPAEHAEYEGVCQAYAARVAAYTADTGAVPMAHWEAFEAWCRNREAANP